ncbi:MAG: hypothetical protein LBD96_01125 [Treponema sp.]|jgi:hypothetical protein|nr:hypothetical protein [Treponema sp.]
MKNLSPVVFRVLVWVLLPVVLFSCGKADTASSGPQSGSLSASPTGQAETEGLSPSPFFPEALVALLRPAETPLWFEVSAVPTAAAVSDGAALLPEGPRHIKSPAESELVPFTPWPLAPHVAATLAGGELLYLAVNRDSLLAIVPLEGGDLGLYRFAATDYWELYTVGNLFLYGDMPALFFYRDDNFTEPTAPPPAPPVLALDSPPAGTAAGTAALVPLAIPALAGIAEGWETDILRQGTDGLWYYRELRRINGGRELRYFRSPGLAWPGEEVGAGTYRDAQAPGGPAEIPEERETLPPLPENFVYTHVNRLGNYVVAAWEEQEDYSIGAAGFMVLRRVKIP